MQILFIVLLYWKFDDLWGTRGAHPPPPFVIKQPLPPPTLAQGWTRHCIVLFHFRLINKKTDEFQAWITKQENNNTLKSTQQLICHFQLFSFPRH